MPQEKLYSVVVNFVEPVEGMVMVSAKTPEEAKEKAAETFKHRREVTIVDAWETQERQLPLPMFNNGDNVEEI